MTRQQRALACAVGIIPTTIAGIALMKCGCAVDAYLIEITTAVGYLIFVLFAPRGQR